MAIVLRQSGGLLRQAAIRLSASAHAPFPEQVIPRTLDDENPQFSSGEYVSLTQASKRPH